MLCFEGIAMNLNVFLGNTPFPNYRLVSPPSGELQTVTVKPEVSRRKTTTTKAPFGC